MTPKSTRRTDSFFKTIGSGEAAINDRSGKQADGLRMSETVIDFIENESPRADDLYIYIIVNDSKISFLYVRQEQL